MKIIDFLKEKVAEVGTQSAVARKTGVSHGTINKILSGDTRPELDTIRKIAAAYCIDLSELEEISNTSLNSSVVNVRPPKPQRISDLLTSYSPEVRLIADSIEMQVQGKTAEERAEFIKGVMEQIWGKGR